MKKDYKLLLKQSAEKVLASLELIEASLNGLEVYDSNKLYTPKELEPYDALSDRFIRGIETCIKFFKTYEYFLNLESSDTYRDLLNKMVKNGIISDSEIWIEMRDVRNRIVHDYLPQQIKSIFDLIMEKYGKELSRVKEKILILD